MGWARRRSQGRVHEAERTQGVQRRLIDSHAVLLGWSGTHVAAMANEAIGAATTARRRAEKMRHLCRPFPK
eukprot:1071755-Prymnesium_polylepis.1